MTKLSSTNARRIVSGENVTAVTSHAAIENVIAAKTGADNAIGALDHSTKSYAKLRNKESADRRWMLRINKRADKELRKVWDDKWEAHALTPGKKKSPPYFTGMVSCRVQYGRARCHAAALVLDSANNFNAKEKKEANEIIATYGDSKKTAKALPFDQKHLERLKTSYRGLESQNSKRKVYESDLADLKRMLARHGVNVADL